MTRREVTDEDRVSAARAALSVVASGGSVEDLVRAMAPLHVSGWLFPGDMLIGLAVDALGESGATRASPLDAVSLYEEFLPECEFRGNTARAKSAYALRAVAMTHGGVRPDLDADAGWYRADDFWLYATYAFVAYAPAAAARSGRSIKALCTHVALINSIELPE